MQIDRHHIRELIAAGVVSVFPESVSVAAEKTLIRCFPLRLSGGVVAWDQIPLVMECKWMETADADVVKWALKTTAGKHAKALLLFSSDEPCVVGDFDQVMRNLDILAWSKAGPLIVFGTDVLENAAIPSCDVIEFNGIDRLFGVSTLESIHVK